MGKNTHDARRGGTYWRVVRLMGRIPGGAALLMGRMPGGA